MSSTIGANGAPSFRSSGGHPPIYVSDCPYPRDEPVSCVGASVSEQVIAREDHGALMMYAKLCSRARGGIRVAALAGAVLCGHAANAQDVANFSVFQTGITEPAYLGSPPG